MIFFAALLMLAPLGAAETAASDDLGFARSLQAEGDYYRAIGEAKRFLYDHPGDARGPEARLLVGRCYLSGGQWVAAASVLAPLSREVTTGPVGEEAAFSIAEVRMGSGDYDLAALEYSRFSEDFPGASRAALARLRVAWARMFSADLLSNVDAKKGRAAFLAAARELDTLPDGFTERARAQSLAAGARRIATLRLRSPALAGVLSAVLPGAGQLYAGRGKDAIIALFVNALFIGGAVESFARGNTVASAILVLFEMGWYTGNIYSAVNSAHRTNDFARQNALGNLKKDLYAGVAPLPAARGEMPGGLAFVGMRF